MITFHNDHLVAPELCKLLYDAVPVEFHLPVVFTAHGEAYPDRRSPGKLPTLGTCYLAQAEPVVGIHLQSIFYHGLRHCYSRDASLWYTLVEVCLHEFGHIATINSFCGQSQRYDEDWQFRGVVERTADAWKAERLAAILHIDRDLRQPRRLGAYLDGRLVKMLAQQMKRPRHNQNHKTMADYRARKCGGQLTTGEVAERLGFSRRERYRPAPGEEIEEFDRPDGRRVSRVAGDLARVHVDRAGRRHCFFLWGDLPEIAERMAVAPSGKRSSHTRSGEVGP